MIDDASMSAMQDTASSATAPGTERLYTLAKAHLVGGVSAGAR